MPLPRGFAVSVVLKGKLYVAGGGRHDDQIVNDPECLDPQTDSWYTLEPMPTARASSVGTCLAGRLYVFGGHREASDAGRGSVKKQQGVVDKVECYDPRTGHWTSFTSKPMPRQGGFAAAVC